MFFNDDPQKFFPYSQIEVVDLRNGPEGDDMTEKIFRGPIDSMISRSQNNGRQNSYCKAILDQTVLLAKNRLKIKI